MLTFNVISRLAIIYFMSLLWFENENVTFYLIIMTWYLIILFSEMGFYK